MGNKYKNYNLSQNDKINNKTLLTSSLLTIVATSLTISLNRFLASTETKD